MFSQCILFSTIKSDHIPSFPHIYVLCIINIEKVSFYNLYTLETQSDKLKGLIEYVLVKIYKYVYMDFSQEAHLNIL